MAQKGESLNGGIAYSLPVHQMMGIQYFDRHIEMCRLRLFILLITAHQTLDLAPLPIRFNNEHPVSSFQPLTSRNIHAF
jgi:hypothetical protein